MAIGVGGVHFEMLKKMFPGNNDPVLEEMKRKHMQIESEVYKISSITKVESGDYLIEVKQNQQGNPMGHASNTNRNQFACHEMGIICHACPQNSYVLYGSVTHQVLVGFPKTST